MSTTTITASAVPQIRDNFCQAVLQGANDPQICSLITRSTDVTETDIMRDDRKIHTYFAPAIGTPKGDVVLLYGFTDSTALHPSDIRELQQMGYNVHSMDWYGQGLSGRPDPSRPTVPSSDFPAMIADLSHFIKTQVEPKSEGRPLHMTAHSMGGHLGLRYIHDNPRTFESAVLIAPMLDLNVPRDVRPLVSGVANIGVLLGGGDRRIVAFDPTDLPANDNEQPSLYARAQSALKAAFHFATHPTFGWLNSALNGIKQVQRPAFQREAASYTDLHFITGGRDQVVGNLADDIHVGKTLTLSEAGHSPLSENDGTRRITLDYMNTVFARFTQPELTPTMIAQNAPTPAKIG